MKKVTINRAEFDPDSYTSCYLGIAFKQIKKTEPSVRSVITWADKIFHGYTNTIKMDQAAQRKDEITAKELFRTVGIEVEFTGEYPNA